MFKKNKIENYDKIRINYNTYLDKNKSNKPTLVVGACGSGKTSAFFVPNIMNSKDDSLVILDRYEDLYKNTKDELIAKNYKIININETNIFLNDLNLYNKDLSEIKTQEDIEKILNEIFNIKNEDDYYENIEVCLLKAIAKHLLNKDNLNKLSDILNFFLKEACLEEENLKKIIEENKNDKYIEKNINEFLFFSQGLDFIDLNKFKEKINNMFYQNKETTSFNSLDFKPLRNKAIAIFLQIDIFYKRNDLFENFIEELLKQSKQNPEGRKITLFLDDFTSLNKINNLLEILKYNEKYNINTYIGIQSFLQLEDKYKEDYNYFEKVIGNYLFFSYHGIEEYNELLEKLPITIIENQLEKNKYKKFINVFKNSLYKQKILKKVFSYKERLTNNSKKIELKLKTKKSKYFIPIEEVFILPNGVISALTKEENNEYSMLITTTSPIYKI